MLSDQREHFAAASIVSTEDRRRALVLLKIYQTLCMFSHMNSCLILDSVKSIMTSEGNFCS